MSAIETELARATARRSLTPPKTRRHDGEVLSLTSTTRAAVDVAGQTHLVSTVGETVAAGDTVTVEWGSAIPRVAGVRTPGGSAGGVLTGSILEWGGTTAPAGYLLCDGSAVSRTTYADLFDVTGTRFGSGDGSTTFNLPDYDLGGNYFIIKT